MSAVLAEQGSAIWIEQRLGCLTASRFADAVAKLKGGEWAVSRHNYMMELLAERLTGQPAAHFVSREMLEGIENEEAAIAAYEWDQDCQTEHLGFIRHPTILMAGASPDRGVIGKKRIVEAKAPKSNTFVELVLKRRYGRACERKREDADDGYIMQTMWQLACLPDYEGADLVYFDPRMPPDLQLYIRPIERDSKIIVAMESQAREFLDELAELEALMRGQAA